MATGYPFKKYNFNVLIDGKAVGYFQKFQHLRWLTSP